MPIKAREVGDLDAARKRNKGGSAGDYALTVRPDSELLIRFYEEPNKWTEFWQHYMADAEPRAFPCQEDDCVGCDAGNKATKKWAAKVLDVNDGKIRVFIMGKSVWEILLGRRCMEKYQTILDRNYTIVRTGSGKNDTDYDVDPDERSKMNWSKYREDIRKLDVTAFLEAQIPSAAGDDEEDEQPRRRGAKKPTSRRGGAPRQRASEEDDDTPWEDDEEEAPVRRRPAKKTASKPAASKPAARRRIPRR